MSGEEIVCGWIRSEACGVGLKMMLDRKSVQPLADAIDAALAARTAERDEARRAGMEEAARIADEWAAENLRMAMDSIHLDPALAKGDFSPAAQKMTDLMQAHGAHHSGAHAGCEQVAKAIRAASTERRT